MRNVFILLIILAFVGCSSNPPSDSTPNTIQIEEQPKQEKEHGPLVENHWAKAEFENEYMMAKCEKAYAWRDWMPGGREQYGADGGSMLMMITTVTCTNKTDEALQLEVAMRVLGDYIGAERVTLTSRSSGGWHESQETQENQITLLPNGTAKIEFITRSGPFVTVGNRVRTLLSFGPIFVQSWTNYLLSPIVEVEQTG